MVRESVESARIVSFEYYWSSEILWVMPTSAYIPNTDRCFFIIVVFSF